MSTAKVCLQCGTQFDGDTRFCPHDGSALKYVDPGSALVGQVIADRFLVEKKLGQGGMGEVYLAEQVRIGRKCALKVIRPALVQDADSVLRFNREASNAARISHANVVQVYDFGEAKDGTIFLAMEFIEGESLAALLEREGKVAPRRAVSITTQVASALSAAHELKIVHRDLKPDNIMLARARDGSDLVKVVDFGVSRIMDSAEQKVTGTGLVIGTPEYMSPEQFTGMGIDERSDVYSLALIVFRMLAGAPAFEASGVQQALEARFSSTPRRLAEVNPRIQWPAGLQEVLDRGLAVRVEDRYQTVEQFATAVAAITTYWDPEEGRIPSIVAPASAAPAPPPLFTPTPRASTAPIASGSATGVLSGAAAATPAATSPPAPSAAPAAPVSVEGATREASDANTPKRAGLAWVAVLLVVVGGGAFAVKGLMGNKETPAPSSSSLPTPDSSSTTTASLAPTGDSSGQRTAGTDSAPPPVTPSVTAPAVATPPSPKPANAVTGEGEESPQVLEALERLRTLTDSSATATEARRALSLANTISPITRAGRVERKYRMLEANILLDRQGAICALIGELKNEAAGTRFESAVQAYVPVAQATCR